MLNESPSATHQTSQDREQRRQLILEALRREAQATLDRLADELVDLPDDKIFGPLEYTLRDISHEFISRAHQAGIDASKKGHIGSTDVCPFCQQDARFINFRPKYWLTIMGEVTVQRAYYYCKSCHQGHFPFDQLNALPGDHLSSGLRPLVCLAGTLTSFRDATEDLLRRFCGVNVSASVARRVTEQAGERLLEQQRLGQIVVPTKSKPWDFTIEGHSATAAFIGLDAFSVPIQKSGGKKADYRMLYTATLYTPNKEHTHYLVDFDLNQIGRQLREASKRLGLDAAHQLVAISDGGNGLEEALQRHFWADLTCILDWYHASEHLHDYAKILHGRDESARAQWVEQAKSILYEQGGTALLKHLREQSVPVAVDVAEELRKLIGYFENNEDRTDYPSYRSHGWDIGSGPTEAGCKIVGARLKGSGMRWLEEGAAEVAPLRALYQSGAAAWDAFFALAV